MNLSVNKKSKAKLIPIDVDSEIVKQFNLHQNDYKVFVDESNNLISNTLYRIGVISLYNPDNKYNLLLKHIFDETNKHLFSRWCIVNQYGEEKYVHHENRLKTPRIIANSCIYRIEDEYYNIETGYHYGYASKSVENNEILILDLKSHWSNKEKNLQEGLFKINKETGIGEYM